MTTPPPDDDDGLGLLGTIGDLTAAANNEALPPEVRAIAEKTADQARQREG